MTFSSRWLLAFRVGGATVALLTHCPACHVVFNHSSWLIPSSSKPPARRCAASVLQLMDSEMAAIFKRNKSREITFFKISSCSSLLNWYIKKKQNPSPLLVWNLISAAWSVWEFGPRQVLLVTSSCERPTEKRSHTCPYFLITQPAQASSFLENKRKTNLSAL